MGRCSPCRHGVKPTGQPGVFVGKQRNQPRVGRRHHAQAGEKNAARRGICLKSLTLDQQAAFAQQTARTRLKPGKEKVFLYVFMLQRGQTMTPHHPVFGTQIVEIEPQRRLLPRRHGLQVGVGQLAGERSDHHIGAGRGLPFALPATDLDTLLPLPGGIDLDGRAQALKGTQIINPQAHGTLMLRDQLSGQAPGHPDIAEVIHHGTKNIPGHSHSGLSN